MTRRRKPVGALDGSEAEFSRRVVDLAHRAGWRENRTYPSRAGGAWRTTTSSVGFPDHILIKRGRLVVLELKIPGGKPTPEQVEWIDLFASIPGCVARVVWPADWPWIVDTLTKNPERNHQ